MSRGTESGERFWGVRSEGNAQRKRGPPSIIFSHQSLINSSLLTFTRGGKNYLYSIRSDRYSHLVDLGSFETTLNETGIIIRSSGAFDSILKVEEKRERVAGEK